MRHLSLFAAVQRPLRMALLAGLATLVALAVLLTPTVGDAQTPYDHLKCYKMKDAQEYRKYEALVDLMPLPSQQDLGFPVTSGCKVKVKGRLFCIPAIKGRDPQPEDPHDAPSEVVEGQDLVNDFICYKMKCPRPTSDADAPPELQEVIDQFGQRAIGRFKPQIICAPANKLAPASTTTTTTTTTVPGPVCAGCAAFCSDADPCPAGCESDANCIVRDNLALCVAEDIDDSGSGYCQCIAYCASDPSGFTCQACQLIYAVCQPLITDFYDACW